TKRAEIQIRILALNFYMWKRFTGQQYLQIKKALRIKQGVNKRLLNSGILYRPTIKKSSQA
ncbi:hypothetical protein, partial [Prevotella sp.]|uniref:hypothetical protein n=1 Tax=Prevotella sp. TaxID=59823 RepID=UPI0025806C26